MKFDSRAFSELFASFRIMSSLYRSCDWEERSESLAFKRRLSQTMERHQLPFARILLFAFVGLLAVANPASGASYFEPKSPQERPVHRPAGCGNEGSSDDSYITDFEGGNLTLIPTYDDANLLSLNLIFRYWHQAQGKASPEKVEVHALPEGRVFFVKKIYRSSPKAIPDVLSEDGYMEEAYLEFLVQPNDVKHIEIVFPDGTIIRERREQKIPRVLFDYVGHATSASRSKMQRCLYSTEPPSRLDGAKLKPPPVVLPLKASNLTGTWIVDGKASGEAIKNSHSAAADEYLSAGGWMFFLIFEFSEGVVTQGSYITDDKRVYRLLPEKSSRTKLVYKAETPQGNDDDLLAVSAAGINNIRISSFPEEISFKRVKLNRVNKQQDAKRVSEAVQEFMKIIAPVSSNVGK